jgi:competence protein ComGC
MEEKNSTTKIVWSIIVIAVLLVLVIWGLTKTKSIDEIVNEVPYEQQATTDEEQATAAAIQAQSASDATADIESDLDATDIEAAIWDK